MNSHNIRHTCSHAVVVLWFFHGVFLESSAAPFDNVLTPPSFTESLQSSTYYFSLYPGEVLTLPCVATGWPKPVYAWLFNGAAHANLAPTHDGTLILTKLTSAIQGYYQCIARNSVGTALSNNTRVLQAIQAAFNQTPAVTITATVGQKLVIHCQPRVTTVPAPQSTFYSKDFDWKYAGYYGSQESVPLGRRIQIDENGNLNIAYVKMADSRQGAVLTCYITNRISSITAEGSSVTLTVTDPGTATATVPAIMFYTNQTLNPQGNSPTVLGLEGRNSSLRCFFSGSENIDVRWTRRDGQLPTDGRVEKLNYNTELLIKDVQKSDEDIYVCTGNGPGGPTDFPINFVVQAVPVFKFPDSKPHDVKVSVGDDVTIQCDPYAIPDASVVWYKNGVALDPSNRDLATKFRWSNSNRMLTVLRVCKDNCTANDNGRMVIQCNASNVHGYVFANGYINVFVRTVLIKKPESIIILIGDLKIITVEATSDPSTPIKYSWLFKGNNQEYELLKVTPEGSYFFGEGENGTSLTIFYRDESIFGSYKVIASNGISEESSEFRLQSGDGVADPGNPIGSLIAAIVAPLISALLVCIAVIIVLLKRTKNQSKQRNTLKMKQLEKNAVVPPERPDEPAPPAPRQSSDVYDEIGDGYDKINDYIDLINDDGDICGTPDTGYSRLEGVSRAPLQLYDKLTTQQPDRRPADDVENLNGSYNALNQRELVKSVNAVTSAHLPLTQSVEQDYAGLDSSRRADESKKSRDYTSLNVVCHNAT